MVSQNTLAAFYGKYANVHLKDGSVLINVKVVPAKPDGKLRRVFLVAGNLKIIEYLSLIGSLDEVKSFDKIAEGK